MPSTAHRYNMKSSRRRKRPGSASLSSGGVVILFLGGIFILFFTGDLHRYDDPLWRRATTDPVPSTPVIRTYPMYRRPFTIVDEDDSPRIPDTRSRTLQGNIDVKDSQGTHFVELYIGTPTVKRTMSVDTNSDYTAFPCMGCDNCGEAPLFEFEKSRTFNAATCGTCSAGSVCENGKCAVTHWARDSSSWSAFQANDVVYIGGGPDGTVAEGTDAASKFGFELMFGCETSVRGWFKSQVNDGMMGMSAVGTSFINQMFDAGFLPARAFAMCFSHKLRQMDDGTSSGSLSLGGADPRYHDTPLVWAENTRTGLAEALSYTLYLKKMYLREGGGQSVRPNSAGMRVINVDFDSEKVNSGSGVAIDTGIPYTFLSDAIDGPFKRAWKKVTGQEFTYGKVRLLDGDLLRLPTLLFQFRAFGDIDRSMDPYTTPGMAGELDSTSPFDILLAVPATHYMEYNSASGYFRARISFDSKGYSALGANLLQGHDIAFDLDNHKIGLAESAMCVLKSANTGNYADDDLFASNVDIIAPGVDSPWKGQVGFAGGPDIDNNNNPGSDYNPGLPGKNGGSSTTSRRPVGSKRGDLITSYGLCTTVVCKSFVAVGYMAAILTAFVIFKCAQFKRGDGEEFGDENEDGEFDDYNEDNEFGEADRTVNGDAYEGDNMTYADQTYADGTVQDDNMTYADQSYAGGGPVDNRSYGYT